MLSDGESLQNQYLACPPMVARTLSPGMQHQVGYAMSDNALGCYGDLRHPAEALLSDE